MDFLKGKTILHKENETISADVALKKKTLILYYFTSGNCETCRAFDAKLKNVYHEALDRQVELAVVTVNSDTDKQTFLNNKRTNYYEWYAIPHDDDLVAILTYNYGITHIPTVVVVRKNGELVTKEGRSDVENLGINALVTWSE